jgi:CheY-like chemotaxis protein
VIPVTRVEDVLPTLKEFRDNIGLIVLDIIMPPEEVYTLEETDGGTTTGLRLLKDIRKEYKDIPIIIVSIRRLKDAEDIRERFNVAEYLEKPVSAFTVAKAIKSSMT